MTARRRHLSVFSLVLCGLLCTATGFLAGRSTRESTNPLSAAASPAPVFEIQSQHTAETDAFQASSFHHVTSALTPASWKSFLESPATHASEQNILAQLRTLAVTDPAQALQLAQSAPTPRQRDAFIRAALQGWASTDPAAATRWALDNVRLGDRRLAFEAVTTGAIDLQPEAAIAAARFICAADPLLQSDHGASLITALTRAGRFDLATRFAVSAPGEYRAYWLATAFSQWAQYQPFAALEAARALPGAPERGEALQGLVTGWAGSDPASLVAHAATLPAGDLRTFALRDGLQQWASRDPVAASAWMDRLDPSRDLDAGAATIATTPVIVEKNPDAAASWAESIVDPELRANTLLDLVRLWAESDPAAARSYATNTPALRPETRALALASFSERTAP